MIFYIIGYGIMAKVSVYDSLVADDKDGIRTVGKIGSASIDFMTTAGGSADFPIFVFPCVCLSQMTG